MRLTFVPQSFFSWNYWVQEQDIIGAIEFNFWSEAGQISIGSTPYLIQHEWLSGRWSLISNNTVQASAVKYSAFTRSFDVTYGNQRLFLSAESFWSSALAITRHDGTRLGNIRRIQFLSRKAELDCSPEVGILIQLFLFWLTALTWRRSSSSSNTSGC